MQGTAPSALPLPLSTYGGLVTLADPATVPDGASPRTYDTAFLVGRVQTRAGLTNVYSQVDQEDGPNGPSAAASSTWNTPAAILTGGYATFSPVANQNSLTLTEYAFNVPSTASLSGILLAVTGYSNAPASLQAQLTINGALAGAPKTLPLPQSASTLIFGSLTDLWGTNMVPANANSLQFGVVLTAINTGFSGATVFVNGATVALGVSTGTSNFQFITTFVDQQGNVKNVAIDANGNFWMENVTVAPGTLTLVRTGIAQNAMVVAANGPSVEYMAFGNGFQGIDMPLQYTPNWTDRITQVGPGAAPTFTPITSSGTQYPIENITQPVAKSQGYSYFLQSAGPGSTSPGNVITFYYLDSTQVSGPDQDLVNAFNSGNSVYLYASFTGTPQPFGPQVVEVTAVGEAQPPGQPRNFYYFCFQVPSIAYTYYKGSGNPGYTANYQRTLATLTTTNPVPNLLVGGQMTVTGVTPTTWNSVWTITQTPNASEMAITGSQVSGGVATFNYSVTNGTNAPVVGELVTITNMLNGGGALNIANATIASTTGGNTGTFTVNVSLPNYAFEAETGLATTAGTIFVFDPGAALVGTSTNPIYGTGTGGNLVFNASGLFIDPGTYQGTVFFITRNGMYTAPAPPVTFTVPVNATNLQVTNLPIGPPNVVGRGIAITEAGQNGVPGGNFFTLPQPVTFYSQDTQYTATQFFVNDNISASVTLFFTGAILDQALAIDVYGYNLFEGIEIGDPGWTGSYAGRQFYGQCVNKIQNFVNLSFDGGYLAGQTAPLGWTSPDAYGALVVSPKFGNSYYIKNTSAGTLPVAGMISQTAFQDAYKTAIIDPNTTYSVRVTASNPSGVTGGSLQIALMAAGSILGAWTTPLTSLTASLSIYTGTLLTSGLTAQQLTGLTLVVQAVNLAPGADVLIDRFDVVPTEIPILGTTVFGSYAGLPEQVDAVTGQIVFTSENQQPVNGMTVLYDTFYGFKGWSGRTPGSSLYSLQKSSNLEPADWNEPEVSQRAGGAIGPLAFDRGEQWFLGASRAGLYLFVGGQPGKINQEIYQVWDAINWDAGSTIWVKVDIVKRVIYVGVPLPTPNFWLPNAPANAAPSSPNVILMCDFKGIDSGEMLKAYPQMHTTMFGALNAVDMRRKWSIWQIPSPYGAIVQGTHDEYFAICSGRGNSKVYKLDETASTDDGLMIDSLYTTAGMPHLSKRQQMPQLGPNRVLLSHMQGSLASGGNVQVTLYPNVLLGPEESTADYLTWQIPGGITPGSPALNDFEANLNFQATRTFVEFRQNDGNPGWSLSNFVMQVRKSVWQAMRGRTGL